MPQGTDSDPPNTVASCLRSIRKEQIYHPSHERVPMEPQQARLLPARSLQCDSRQHVRRPAILREFVAAHVVAQSVALQWHRAESLFSIFVYACRH